MKFKVYCKITKTIEEPCSWFLLGQSGMLYDSSPCIKGLKVVPKEEYEILFFTGFEDGNKVEIYRYDILEHVGRRYLVDWHFNRWVLREIIRNMKMREIDKLTIEAGWLKKIGNKFTNPELLEE